MKCKRVIEIMIVIVIGVLCVLIVFAMVSRRPALDRLPLSSPEPVICIFDPAGNYICMTPTPAEPPYPAPGWEFNPGYPAPGPVQEAGLHRP